MMYIIYNHKRYYINIALLKKNVKMLIAKIFVVAVLISPFMYFYIDFCRFPEKYLTTWKYQLHNEIKSGNQESIDYYNRVYVANGIDLFEE